MAGVRNTKCVVRSRRGAEQQQQPSGLNIANMLDLLQQTLMVGGHRLQLGLDSPRSAKSHDSFLVQMEEAWCSPSTQLRQGLTSELLRRASPDHRVPLLRDFTLESCLGASGFWHGRRVPVDFPNSIRTANDVVVEESE